MPEAVVVDFPGYAGPRFYDDDVVVVEGEARAAAAAAAAASAADSGEASAPTTGSRATRVPLLPRTRQAEHHPGVTRTQYPLRLAWAITPWKAQGMTLGRARVQLTRGASTPGVAFVALSRVRHPDHLVLDDDFRS